MAGLDRVDQSIFLRDELLHQVLDRGQQLPLIGEVVYLAFQRASEVEDVILGRPKGEQVGNLPRQDEASKAGFEVDDQSQILRGQPLGIVQIVQ